MIIRVAVLNNSWLNSIPFAPSHRLSVRMSSSKLSSLSEELACPVCFEDFVEPKCLPSCAHNVCKACLKQIVSSRKKSECPLCREAIKVPRGGVDAIPTNTLLVRLVERIKAPSRDLTDGKIKKVVEIATNLRLDARRKGEEIKKTIHDEINAFTGAIRKRELKLCSEVDDLVQVYEKQVPFYQIQRTVSETDKMVKASDKAVKHEKPDDEEIASLLPKIQGLNLNCPDDELAGAIGMPTFSLHFDIDDSCTKFVKRFGTLKAAGGDGKQLGVSDSLAATTTKSTPPKVKVIKTITATDLGDTSFAPYAVTVSDDWIGILDDDLNRVHVLTDKGNHVCSFTIKYGDLYDLAFVGSDSIYVVNRSHKSIIRYFCDGRYRYPYITGPPMCRYNPSTSFTSISAMMRKGNDRLLVSVEALNDSCILICDNEGNWLDSIGNGDLQCPRKALWHSGEYFVCDRDLGCVKVFNCDGLFVREFGEDLDSPRGLAIDEDKGDVLVSDPGSNTIHVYNVDGTFLTMFDTEAPPVSIAMLKDGNLIACFHDELYCAQIFSYSRPN